MRPRQALILTLLAAIPVALAVALTGGGRGRIAGGNRLGTISLKLLDGSDAGTVTACAKTHHYESYSSRGTIRFRGAISPPGHWTVALKLKACYSGAFQSAGDIPARVRPDGRYRGSFPAPIAGDYYARSELLRGGELVTQSEKRYFEVR